tara:strand:- start:1579 stop:1710 length:132 start_codon:yes stop_codon:yes gene_type:complete
MGLPLEPTDFIGWLIIGRFGIPYLDAEWGFHGAHYYIPFGPSL